MNLMLVPTQMISGPLADHFGYKAYFIIVMFAAIPSVLSAVYAPPSRGNSGRDLGRWSRSRWLQSSLSRAGSSTRS